MNDGACIFCKATIRLKRGNATYHEDNTMKNAQLWVRVAFYLNIALQY